MKKIFSLPLLHKKTTNGARAKILSNLVSCAIALFILLIASTNAQAITRADLLSGLWSNLNYAPPTEMNLPPDVPITHPHAKPIGYAAKYGLISRAEPFFPDEEINRHEAVRLTLAMIGWRFEATLYESLATLPEFGGSGDNLFFLAAEMKPAGPEQLLVDGLVPLSENGRSLLISWAKNCQKSVRWNRVFSYEGTDLIIFRQGAARPGEPNTPGTGNPVGAPACEPLYVVAVAVHPIQVDQHIAFAEPLGKPRATPSEFAQAYAAIAAVNGGFFSGARPLGTMLLEGDHAGKPLVGRSAIGWNNEEGTFVFGKGDARIGVRAAGQYVEFSKFNVAPNMNEASLYNSNVAMAAMGTALDALELIVTDGVVNERREGADNNHWIPDNSTMIVARGTAREKLASLKPGDAVSIVTDWTTGAFASTPNLIQAGPMLMRNGQFTADAESFKADVLDKRHPRTIMGTDGTRMIWAVVDGRSALHSRGTTMEETRWVAKSLGMTSAVNMDGGGSSQLVWRGILTNSPSDGKERPIPYTILMTAKGTNMARRNLPDQGEFGTFGYTTQDERDAVCMDVYDPLKENAE